MQRIVVFTGAGISAESGIRTFRDSGGLWEQYDIREVATPEAFESNPELVISFYNSRRKQVLDAQPNEAHKALARLEDKFSVQVITQNIDDLHERAGSTHVMHLHGEIRKVRSTRFPELVYLINGWEQKKEDLCEKGFPLRPHIVWFGEMVPYMDLAIEHISSADLLMIIGTSLEVWPSAGLIHYASDEIPKFYIDPKAHPVNKIPDLKLISQPAGIAVPELVDQLLQN
ncbi:MAG: NAD-dependent deacylase [Bacteroidia bacterium]|nr:NAD-dependent deacylase [Bacteroidia bacterium]MCZ2277439.1 NAD-dependent deacylase [Bacteroidia bacterium]